MLRSERDPTITVEPQGLLVGDLVFDIFDPEGDRHPTLIWRDQGPFLILSLEHEILPPGSPWFERVEVYATSLSVSGSIEVLTLIAGDSRGQDGEGFDHLKIIRSW